MATKKKNAKSTFTIGKSGSSTFSVNPPRKPRYAIETDNETLRDVFKDILAEFKETGKMPKVVKDEPVKSAPTPPTRLETMRGHGGISEKMVNIEKRTTNLMISIRNVYHAINMKLTGIENKFHPHTHTSNTSPVVQTLINIQEMLNESQEYINSLDILQNTTL